MQPKPVRERYQVSQDANRVARLKKLYELSMTMSGDPVDVFRHVARMIGELLDVPVVCMSEIRGEDLYFICVYIDNEVVLDAGQCALDITPCATVKESRDIRVYQGVAEMFPKATFLKEHNADAYCGFPSIDSQGGVLAVTCLLDSKPREFSDEDLDLLRIFGQRIGMEIERKNLMSERAQAEEALHQAQKMEAIGQLTGGVAHDFNNLLSVILGNAEMIRDRYGEDGRMVKHLDAVMHAATRGAELTQQLLAFSRRQALAPESIRLDQRIAAMIGVLHRALGETIDIETRFAADLWPCNADPGQVESALLNMCINARDAMPRGGKLTIETRNVVLKDEFAATQSEVSPGDYVVLAVTDDGHGMAAEVVDHVFEPFFTTKEVGQGTGLGLSMVFGFAKQSGGHVSIYSEEGAGTTVELFLPRAAETEAPAVSARAGEQLHARGETVLVVEDDPDVRALAVRQLRKLAYQVIEAADAASALALLAGGRRVDLLFTDVVLPGGVSGPELAAKCKARFPRIKILYTSGYTNDAIAHRGKLDDGVSLLGKPYLRRELARKVHAALEDRPEH